MKGSVLFTELGATIYDSAGMTVNFSPKLPTDRVWTLNRQAPSFQTADYCNATVRHDNHADFVAYAHACFFSPSVTTFSKALSHGWLKGFPRLTLDLFRGNIPLSVATAKGHLDLNRQNQRSTRFSLPLPAATSDDTDHADDPPDDDGPALDPSKVLCLITSLRDKDTTYSDPTGKFPVQSFLGNNYVLLSYFNGFIHTEPLPDRSEQSLITAYAATFAYYRRFGHLPKYQRMDNETSTKLNDYLRNDAHVCIQFVPPNNKRTNKAERYIRAWKNHFISGLQTADPRFPLQCWDFILPQADDTYALLHEWKLNPLLSAYEGFHGHKYDFNARPIAPVGTHVVVYETPDQRASWAAHGQDGWYLGSAPDHYRTYIVWIHSTRHTRLSDTLAWFPSPLHMPGSSPTDVITAALSDLIAGLKQYCTNPARTSGTPLPFDETITAALREASNLFSDVRLPAREPPPPSSVVTPISPSESVLLQRVPPLSPTPSAPSPSVPVQLQRVPPPAPGVTIPIQTGPNLNSRPRNTPRTSSCKPLSRSSVHAPSRHYFDHIGRRWTDTATQQRYQITAVVFPPKTKGPGSRTCHFRFFDIDQHATPPLGDDAYDITPCSEILQNRSSYVEFLDALRKPAGPTPNARRSAANALRFSSPPVDSLGTRHLAAALSLPPHVASFRNKHKESICSNAASIPSHLNLNPDGSPLTYKGTLTGPNAAEWRRMDAAEISRLINSGTMTAIHISEVPLDRRSDITYYNPQVKEKYDAVKDELRRRVRGTFGGDRTKMNYPGLVTQSTADLVTVKLLLHSVVSDRSSKQLPAKFATLDIEDFFLGTPLDRPEYVNIASKYIPQATLDAHALTPFLRNNSVLFRVDKCMYGLPQAAYLSNKHLVTHLATADYIQDPNVPCLFTHSTSGLQFSLVVDDFGVKYTSIADLEHLVRTIELGGWKCKTDLTGSKYLGVTLTWNYIDNWLDTEMPHFVDKGLTRFTGDKVLRGASSPAVYVPPQYGLKVQHEVLDVSKPASAEEKLWIQSVNGYFLYYARVQDPRILPACNDISATQANPTANTVAATWRLLNYLSSHSKHVMRFTGCDMVLKAQSDASYNSRPNSVSIGAGYHYVGNTADDTLNGTLHAICCRIPTVCGSVAEAEYAALYINGQAAAWERTILAALRYPQTAPTTIITDNLCAEGIAMGTLTAKKSKAIAMRYHWIRDRIRLGEFIVTWKPGSTNLADFFSKHLPVQEFTTASTVYMAPLAQ